MPEVINAELQFKAVFGFAVGRYHNAGVVNQDVKASVLFGISFNEAFD